MWLHAGILMPSSHADAKHAKHARLIWPHVTLCSCAGASMSGSVGFCQSNVVELPKQQSLVARLPSERGQPAQEEQGLVCLC